eukprot:3940903-Rhodomonas_salina.2
MSGTDIAYASTGTGYNAMRIALASGSNRKSGIALAYGYAQPPSPAHEIQVVSGEPRISLRDVRY